MKKKLIAVSGFSTLIIVLLLFHIFKYAPFGNNSLVCMDANIQYLDFYSFLKDFFGGQNNIGYSFSKTLEGNTIAIWSYYLTSPFSLLALGFPKENLHSFFDLDVMLKLVLAAVTSCSFLIRHFKIGIIDKVKQILVVILSVGYGLSQYSIAQCSNIMWLDGVYMLPLVLWAVDEIIHNKKGKEWKLSIIVGYSIIANWYTAGINCIFSFGYFIIQILLKKGDFREKKFWHYVIRYGMAMIFGGLLSSALFLPTIGALSSGSRGHLELNRLLDISFNGKLPSVIQNYVYGSKSENGSVALFCGSIALIGCISYFVTEKNKNKRNILAFSLIIAILICYWNPCFVLFSLLKDASSYWYRYSYLSIFIIIIIATRYFLMIDTSEKKYVTFKVACCLDVILLVLDYVNPKQDINYTYKFAIVFLFIGLLLSKIEFEKNNWKKQLLLGGLGVICFGEIMYNTILLMNQYHSSDVEAYKEYTREAEKQIKSIKKMDNTTFRISQTETRNMQEGGVTANYNEALAYNYWSISGYTSSPDDIQRKFLDKLGYRINGDNMCIVNTSILGADSLLGVKYIMSEYPIEGLNKVNNIQSFNKKDTYENPYCLPMAFAYNECNNKTQKENPFEYQNSLYSQLLGRNVQIYYPLNYKIEEGNINTGKPMKYQIEIPKGNYAIYGNLPWFSEIDAQLNVNNKYSICYSRWLSQSVFYIPSDRQTACLEINSKISYDLDRNNSQFYALDLNKLKRVTDELKRNLPEKSIFKNGYVKIDISSNNKQELFVSIPYDKGWKITRNGKTVNCKLVGDCMYSIPLTKGNNVIIMKYEVPYMKFGIMISIVSLFFLIVWIVLEKRKDKNEQ